jgi:dTDP-4-amino-4,6-dideoxygalactose transaminase
MVERFEALCCEMAETSHAVAMSNGTVTLEAIVEALGIGPGDEVITSPFTFAATVNAVLRSGATVRFADVTRDFTIDPDAVASLIGPRTSAILPVHLFGLMADIAELEELAARHGLALIEDAAQAHGATQGARRAGGTGIGSFSFYATKNVAAGEGGVVTTSDAQLARKLRLLRNQGMERSYEFEIVGRNLRMSDLHAAIAVPQLERLAELNALRARNANRLTDLLADRPGLELPRVPVGYGHVWHQYTVLLPPGIDRGALVAQMRHRGVAPGIHYPRLAWDHDAYRGRAEVVVDDTPIAAESAKRCLSLPVHPGLLDDDIDHAAAVTHSALDVSGSRRVA